MPAKAYTSKKDRDKLRAKYRKDNKRVDQVQRVITAQAQTLSLGDTLAMFTTEARMTLKNFAVSIESVTSNPVQFNVEVKSGKAIKIMTWDVSPGDNFTDINVDTPKNSRVRFYLSADIDFGAYNVSASCESYFR